jgi:hypothetical protein
MQTCVCRYKHEMVLDALDAGVLPAPVPNAFFAFRAPVTVSF